MIDFVRHHGDGLMLHLKEECSSRCDATALGDVENFVDQGIGAH